MHIQRLPIPPLPVNRRGHDNQLVFGDKVPDTALFACGFVAWMGLDVEFQRGHEGQHEG